jgi:D-alanyl-D-alanine carboxypeptidase
VPDREAPLLLLADLHRELGVPADYALRRALPLQSEARELVSIGRDLFGRPQRLVPGAARAWRRMRRAARRDGIELFVVSAFRSVEYQAEVIRAKLAGGRSIEDVLSANAAPGFSEHHTGRALDLASAGCPPLEESFEMTAAYAWLDANAGRFGFRLSYPRDNPWGIVYEPWHWAWTGEGDSGPRPARKQRKSGGENPRSPEPRRG